MPLEDSGSSAQQPPATPVYAASQPQNAPQGKKIRPINISKHGLFFLAAIAVIFLIVLVFLLMERGKAVSAPNESKTQTKASIPVKISQEQLDVNKPEILVNDLKKLTGFRAGGSDVLVKTFTDLWSKAKTDRQKWSAYSSVYSSLWAAYNSSGDPTLKAEMVKVKAFMTKTWPSFGEVGGTESAR